jgi:hypothetical protein
LPLPQHACHDELVDLVLHKFPFFSIAALGTRFEEFPKLQACNFPNWHAMECGHMGIKVEINGAQYNL